MAAPPADVPMPDLHDPRVQAAMKVLGVHGRDLVPISAANFEGPQAHFNLFSNKRGDLISKVNSLVATSPADTSKLVESMSRDPNEDFLMRVAQKEQEQIEKLGKQAQKDIMKIADSELAVRVAMKHGQEKKDAAADRFRTLKKERDKELKDKKKEAVKRQEKSIEVRVRAEAKCDEESAKLRAEIEKAQERSTTKLEKIKVEHETHVAGKAQFWDDLAVRLDNHKQEKFDHWMEIHHECNHKQEVVANNKVTLEGERKSNEAFILQREQDAHARVIAKQVEKHEKMEAGYKDIQKRHLGAQAIRDGKDKETATEYRKRNAKERSTFESRYASLQTQLEKPKFSRRLQETGQASISSANPFTRSLSDTQVAAQTQNRGHEQLVDMNRMRLRHAHHYATEQALSKLHSMRMKIDVKKAADREAATRRMDMVANVGKASEELKSKVDRCQNSGPEKMQSLLVEMLDQPDPEAVKSINEKLGKLGMPLLGGDDVRMEKEADK